MFCKWHLPISAVSYPCSSSNCENVVASSDSGMPLLRERYPDFFTRHRQTIPFILTLNEIIHPEVRKLYPGAEAPDFGFRRSAPNELELEYRSKKKMCALAEGLIHGAADVFGEKAVIEQPRCMHRGDESCLMVCRFEPAAS